MDIPMHGRNPTFHTPLPEICVQDSHHPDRYLDRYSDQHRYHSTPSSAPAAGPMSIPNAREAPPPPLPPPRYIPDISENGRGDLGWQWANQHRDINWGGSISSVPAGSSLYGSYVSRNSISDERPDIGRRGSSNATITAPTLKDTSNHSNALPKDEGYSSLSASNASIGSTQSRNSISFAVHDAYQTSAQAYDKSLLQKLGSRGDSFTPSRPFAKSPFSSSVNDASPTSRIAREHGHPTLKPLSLPIHTQKPALAESPINRWADSPSSSGISPGNPYTRLGGINSFDYRSPTDIIDSERSPLPYPRRSGSIADDASSIASHSRDSYQAPSPEYEEGFHMEETSLRRLQIGEEYNGRNEGYSPCSATTGQKRRASSPPRDDGLHLRTVGSASDLARRRESGSRSTPSPRFHSTSTSISSTTSLPRNSFSSTLSVAASSATSLGSYNRPSHGGILPSPMDISTDMSYNGSMSLNPSPRGSISARSTHHRTLSESRPLANARKIPEPLGHVKHNSAPSRQGGFICECCPKKPKKFDTQEELNAHEQEKQYECLYCRNRFKNKNEAERHQNSLHLRRHSWSCAALIEWANAFHPCPTRPSDADTCGYCGEDFPRSGLTSPGPNGHPIPTVTNEDWDHRISHLQDMHKFGECNHAKKFFRADHFRQHLKHSHAGTSGKWTNMLENACMIDEPPPEPLRGPERVSPGGVRVGRINEEDEVL
ncbi:hypothetical protein EYC80_010776 [Monilinia laxa]|uniref:C2H2-type domain-containing protein n=1 Tax=Monilinia laxa TaxID=61186 RepID=A0A5N6JM91_MONLA|nr:hypothetical protein EYC80_010776 [Monilinia laxa]